MSFSDLPSRHPRCPQRLTGLHGTGLYGKGLYGALPRRLRVAASLLITLLTAVPVVRAAELPVVDVYKSASCGCCEIWSQRLRASGFPVRTHDIAAPAAARAGLGMPAEMDACHTAKVGAYVIEGHVPPADIQRLLKEAPQALGLAVPGMPAGSPGMESDQPEHYDTLLVQKDGSIRVFAHH